MTILLLFASFLFLIVVIHWTGKKQLCPEWKYHKYHLIISLQNIDGINLFIQALCWMFELLKFLCCPKMSSWFDITSAFHFMFFQEAFLSSLKALQPEICITAAYGNILPRKFLNIPLLGQSDVIFIKIYIILCGPVLVFTCIFLGCLHRHDSYFLLNGIIGIVVSGLMKLLAFCEPGTVNIHPSLLPQYRGAAPVQRALQVSLSWVGYNVQ